MQEKMSKRAEQAAKEIYKDGIELLGRRDKRDNLIIHPEIMVGILRNACRRGYEQAEKDIIALIESRLSEIIGDAQPKPALRAELQELIKRLKEEKK